MKNIGIFVFDDIELMDFAGPYEVFSVANELNSYQLCRTFTFSESSAKIKSVNGLYVIPDYTVEDCPEIDILIIPGGIGTKKILENDKILSFIKDRYNKSDFTFSVCSGARILAKIGLLQNKKFITHHEVISDILKIDPSAVLQRDVRFVDEGKILTSAGISAGIDLSLYMVEKLFGKDTADKTSAYMEYENRN